MTGQEKQDLFKNELKALLVKYNAELALQDNGRNWNHDYEIVVDFNFDESMDDSGIIPQWIIGFWENGE